MGTRSRNGRGFGVETPGGLETRNDLHEKVQITRTDLLLLVNGPRTGPDTLGTVHSPTQIHGSSQLEAEQRGLT